MSAPSKPDPKSVPSQTNGAPLDSRLQEMQAKQAQLEQTVAELREKVAALEADSKKLQAERDDLKSDNEDYQAALLDLLQKDSPVTLTADDLITRRKIAEIEATGFSFEEIMRELQAN